MKMLTWNTAWNTARASGTSAAVALADRVGADVVLLQEAAPASLWTGTLVGAAVPNRPWGSWIMVRNGVLTEVVVANYAGWVAGARWCGEEDGATTYLFSIHSPTNNANERRDNYVRESVKIVSAICEQVPPDARLVIGGDFNFTSFGERLASEPIQMEREELEALQDFRRRGLTIAWRDLYSQQALPQTLRWSGAPTRPYHCDGFLTRGYSHAGMSCEVLCSEDDISTSDHNPIILQVAGG
jgi:exonuclease III